MTELSPAQAVFDAFGNARDGEYVDGVWVVNERAMLAAALRAAAEQVPDLPKNCSSYDINVQDGREEVRSFLLTIVAELEAQ